jgi:hypothetical protein
MFSECHQQLKAIRRSTISSEGIEGIITNNLITHLSGRLQKTTDSFRKSQGEYLKSIKIIKIIMFDT